MATASRRDDLTIPELFHALKQRLSGIASNCIWYVKLLYPSKTGGRATLTRVTSSNSSGLDLREVHEIGGEILQLLTNRPV